MTDYGHDLEFGTFLTPSAQDPDLVVALARLTEQAGLELATFQDHPYQARFLDTWTLLSVVAAHTTTLRVSPNVANLPLRPPLVLARSAASLDLLSGGRVELGLGSGAFWDAIHAAGGPRLTPAQAVRALEEGIAVIRAVWDGSGPAVRVDGEFYRVVGAHPGPPPAHRIGIWVGAYKPKMLDLTGRLADGWWPSSAYAEPETLADGNARIDEAAHQAGRSPDAVRRIYNLNGRFAARGNGFLQGPAEMWAEQLADLALGEGIGTFVLATDDPDDIRRFAADVVPAVREMVDAERSAAVPAPPAEGAAGGLVAVQADDRPAARDVIAAAVAERSSGSAPGFGVVPTPDDGSRLSDVRVWDETLRPRGPRHVPREYTPDEESAGQLLVDVHDHLRQELAQIRDLVAQVAGGRLDPGAARSAINDMTVRQNNWTLGTYCQQYCRVVTTHHTIEDQSMFPQLRRSDPGLAPVIDRLAEEHQAIHDVLEQVDRALVALVAGPGADTEVRAAVDLLTDTLLSHLSYEERELVEPLARLGFS